MAGWNVRPRPVPLPQERGRPWFVAGLTVDGSAHPVARIFKETGDDSSLLSLAHRMGDFRRLGSGGRNSTSRRPIGPSERARASQRGRRPGEGISLAGVRAGVTTILSTRQHLPNHRYNFFHNISPFLLIKCAWVPFASHPVLLSLLHPRHPTAIPNQMF